MNLKQTLYVGTNSLIDAAKRLYHAGEITRSDLDTMIQRNEQLSNEQKSDTLVLGIAACDYHTIRRYK